MSDEAPRAGGLQISAPARGLLDEAPALRVRGGGPELALLWRARLRDDDGRVWRAQADRPEDLPVAWRPDKAPRGPFAALQSLRPVTLEIRVEAADGRSASRALMRSVVGDGVRLRRWRDGLTGTLCLPARAGGSVAMLDVTDAPEMLATATLAGPLLASRGVLTLMVAPVSRAAASALETARARLAEVPSAGGVEPLTLGPQELVMPPGVPGADGREAAIARATAWDALLEKLGARRRG